MPSGAFVARRNGKVFVTGNSGFPKHKLKLKPACEDWWVCRKPGPLWLGVEEGRIGTEPECPGSTPPSGVNGHRGSMAGPMKRVPYDGSKGRWPANVCLDEEAARLLDEQSGERKSNGRRVSDSGMFAMRAQEEVETGYGDTGGASRFFYVAKASKADRGEGNTHPTVKSLSLMSWLVKLAAPAGGLILDPFAGSGSTLVAAMRTNRRAIGIEMDATYHDIAERRIAAERAKTPLFPGAPC